MKLQKRSRRVAGTSRAFEFFCNLKVSPQCETAGGLHKAAGPSSLTCARLCPRNPGAQDIEFGAACAYL